VRAEREQCVRESVGALVELRVREGRLAVSDCEVVAAQRGVLAHDVGDAELFAGLHACAPTNAAMVSSTEGSSVM
jgi:hypothetical protein